MFDRRFPRLDGLMDLQGRGGLDIRPTLVRVVTDLFLATPGEPLPDEIERFVELVSNLLPSVDEATRATVARKLAADPRAPGSVLERLLLDSPKVVGEVLAHWRACPRDIVWHHVLEGSADLAVAVARRTDLDADLVRVLAHHSAPAVRLALTRNTQARFDAISAERLAIEARTDEVLRDALVARGDVEAAWLAPLFLELPSVTRVRIMEALCPTDAIERRVPALPGAADAIARLEVAALVQDPAVAGEAVAQVFGFARERADALMADPGGEILVAVLRALDAPMDVISRLLIVLHPETARSVRSFYTMVAVAERLDSTGARRLLLALGAETLGEGRTHMPHLVDARTPERIQSRRVQRRSEPTERRSRGASPR